MHLESTDYGSDLSVSDTDSMQPVTESSSGAQSRSSSVYSIDCVHLGHLSYLERGRFERTYHLLVSAGPKFVLPSSKLVNFRGRS